MRKRFHKKKKQQNKPKPERESIQTNKKGFIEAQGIVDEILPNAMFKITLDNGHKILGHLSGKMRMYRIHVLPGDRVTIEMTPYDLTKGRITYRN